MTSNFNRHHKGVYYRGTKLNNALPPNIKILNYNEYLLGDVNWIDLAQDQVMWWALMNTV